MKNILTCLILNLFISLFSTFSFCQEKSIANTKILYVLKEDNKADKYFWDLLLRANDYKVIDVIANPLIISQKYANYKYLPTAIFIFKLTPNANIVSFKSLVTNYHIKEVYDKLLIDDVIVLTDSRQLLLNPDLIDKIVKDKDGNLRIFTKNYNVTLQFRKRSEVGKKELREEYESKNNKNE